MLMETKGFEKLAKLIQEADTKGMIFYRDNAALLSFVKYLFANGVLVPPCEMNSDIWWVDDDNNINREENGIKGIMLCDDGKWMIKYKHGAWDEVGTRFAYLSEEEAKQALKGGAE